MDSPSEPRTRAGRYVTQSAGYRAFIPAPLPPSPPLKLEGTLLALQSESERALGRLDGAAYTLPSPDFFVLMYVRKEAVLSSQIEGTQSSLEDVLAAEAQVLDPESPADVDEVLNYMAALRAGLDRLKELPVSVRLIREMHARLLQGVRGKHRAPGELRTSQNWIGPTGAALREATFVPPPPTIVPETLSDLERFLHAEDEIPLLVKIGLAHAQFETIHPFLDGNGRLGRLLITFLLCERKVLREPILYLSHHFKRNRMEYYARLQAIRDSGDWEGWIRFFLEGITAVGEQAAKTAHDVVQLRERHRAIIANEFGYVAGQGLRVLENLFRLPVITVNRVSAITGTSYQAANDLVGRFVTHGLLTESTGKARYRRFRCGEYIDLFSEK